MAAMAAAEKKANADMAMKSEADEVRPPETQ